jgi:hypothetical protein
MKLASATVYTPGEFPSLPQQAKRDRLGVIVEKVRKGEPFFYDREGDTLLIACKFGGRIRWFDARMVASGWEEERGTPPAKSAPVIPAPAPAPKAPEPAQTVPFRPGQTVICVDPGANALTHGKRYVVAGLDTGMGWIRLEQNDRRPGAAHPAYRFRAEEPPYPGMPMPVARLADAVSSTCALPKGTPSCPKECRGLCDEVQDDGKRCAYLRGRGTGLPELT